MSQIRSLKRLSSQFKPKLPKFHQTYPQKNRTLHQSYCRSVNVLTQKCTRFPSQPDTDELHPSDSCSSSSPSLSAIGSVEDLKHGSNLKSHISPRYSQDESKDTSETVNISAPPKKRGRPRKTKSEESPTLRREICTKNINSTASRKKPVKKLKNQDLEDSDTSQKRSSNIKNSRNPQSNKIKKPNDSEESNVYLEGNKFMKEEILANIDELGYTGKLKSRNKTEAKTKLVDFLKMIHKQRKGTSLPEDQMVDVRNRVDVVDSNLCDDALERLIPSLEKHKGCDIIDLNPGISLWSSKLHEILQPRNHILMEPHPSTYMPIISQLLDKPGSKYHLIKENGLVWHKLENVLSEKYLPQQPILDAGDPRLEQANNTLIVTANIACNQPRRFLGFRSLGSVVIYQFLSAIRTYALFQKYGKVRMLLWINPYDAMILPKHVANRKKAALDAVVSCDHVELVVDTDEPQQKNREKTLEINRVISVIKKMKESGLKIPVGRETRIVEDMRAGYTGSEIEELSPKCLQKELQELKEACAHEDSKMGDDINSKNLSSRRSGSQRTPEYVRMRELDRRYRRRVAKSKQFFDLADDFDCILELYRKSYSATETTNAKNQIKTQIEAKSKTFKESVLSLSPIDAAEVQYLCDNRRVFSQTPPGLFWDRRNAEPLKSNEDEFFPNRSLSLLDITPGFMPKTSQDPAYYDTISFLTMQMCLAPAQSLKVALANLAPGADEWMIAECPSLTDPLKNGCPDLDFLSSRCITGEMLNEICEAWLRWPFKPTREELLQRIGSEAYYDQSEDL